MPSQLYLNNFDTQLTGVVKAAPDTGTPATEIGYGVLQLPGAVGATLPTLTGGNWFMLTLYKLVGGLEDDIEIVKVTAVDTSSGSETRISVNRAQEGTAAQAYAIGDKVSARWTAASAANKLQKTNNLSDLPNAATARTNLGLGTASLVNTGTGPTNAILGNDARLTDSRTPTGAAGGVLSGTYPNPGFAVDMATQTELDNHINDTVGAHDGTAIANTPTGNISATTVQAAINELDSEKEPSITAGTTSQYWRGNKTWADFFTDVRAATLTGLSTATNAVIATGDTVLGALGKLQKQITDNLATLTGHTGAASGAHAATAISNAATGNIAATTVQAAINELDTEKVAKAGDTMTGPLAQAAGSVALPSYTFSGDTNTGVYSPGAGQWAVAVSGIQVLAISSAWTTTMSGAGAGGIDSRAVISSVGNGGANRGVALTFAPAGSANSVDAVRLIGYQEAASATPTAASFAIQVANSSGTLTEVAKINNSGNFGIGTTPSTGARLAVAPNWTTVSGGDTLRMASDSGNSAYMRFLAYGSAYAGGSLFGVGANGFVQDYPGNVGVNVPAGKTLNFGVNNVSKVAIDAATGMQVADRLAVGTAAASSADKLLVTQGADFTLGTDYAIRIAGAGYNGGISLNAASMQIGQNSSTRSLTFHSGPSFAERMRIDGNSGDVSIKSNLIQKQPAPANSNTSVTLTAANLLGRIVTGTPTAGINFTLPTGTLMDGALPSIAVDESVDWSVINLAAATHAITVLAGTGHTVVGNMVVAANTSASFRSRKTAANTFVTYRVS